MVIVMLLCHDALMPRQHALSTSSWNPWPVSAIQHASIVRALASCRWRAIVEAKPSVDAAAPAAPDTPWCRAMT